MKKILLLISIILIICFAFTGCKKTTECEHCEKTTTCHLYTYDTALTNETDTIYLCMDCIEKATNRNLYINLKHFTIAPYIFITLLIIIPHNIYWGFKTYTVVSNKGYAENWFWKGFFLGHWAFVEAASLPDCYIQEGYTVNTKLLKRAEDDANEEKVQKGLAWKCSECSKINANYIGTCACGSSKPR